MTDDSQHWGAPGAGSGPGGLRPTAAAPSVPAGWYPDPWSSGHHRYWDGAAWTTGTFPHGPGDPFAPEGTDPIPVGARTTPSPAAGALRPDPVPVSVPPPAWTPPAYHDWGPEAPPDRWAPAAAPAEMPSAKSRLPSGLGFVALVIGVMIVAGSLATLGGYLVFRHRGGTSSAVGPLPTTLPNIPSPTRPRGGLLPGGGTPGPSGSQDPSAASLSSLVLTQADVPFTVVVQPLVGGNQVSGQPTLDLCNGTFPSESSRTARLQVAGYDGQANVLLSTEAVLYTKAAAAEQAFSELKSVAANCPSTPVDSPVGEATTTTKFNPAPDGGWAEVATVTRQAYDFVTTDDTGATHHAVAVYLRRGRAFVGVYFDQPDSPQTPVAGKTTIESIAAVFAGRLAELPASVVNG